MTVLGVFEYQLSEKEKKVLDSCISEGASIASRLNGVEMEKEMTEKMKEGIVMGTTKKEGHGIETQQIMSMIKVVNG
jgi:hypothetical protein